MVSVVSVGRGSVVRLCHGLCVSVGRGIHGLCILCLRARPVSVLSVRAPGPRLPPVFLNRGTVPVRCSVQFSSVISRSHPARTLLLWPVLVVDLVDVLVLRRPRPPCGRGASAVRALDYQQRYSCAARFAKRKTTDIIRIEALQIVIRVSFARIPHDTALSRNIQL